MIAMRPQTARPNARGIGGYARAAGRCSLLLLAVLACAATGCAAPGWSPAARQRDVAAAARPLLELRPDANWTACYNRLIELGPDSIDYLLAQPAMSRVAAPDDLRVMLHTSLLRLLADPAIAPRLSVNCFETTLDVLHFDPKVRGRSLGTVWMPADHPPRAWHDLYPTDFEHALAGAIDVEADRKAMLSWWRARRGKPATALARRRLQPRVEHLWPVLSRRYADVWTYEAQPEVFLCATSPGHAALLRGTAYDYNLVRAVCIWLGTSESPATRSKLIELVAHRSEVVAHNACFALRHSGDSRIRDVLERYKEPSGPPLPAGVHTSTVLILPERTDTRRTLPAQRPCGEQGSATHEVAQVHARLCIGGRDGDVHRGALRRPRSPSAPHGG